MSSEKKTTRDSPQFEDSVATSRHGGISRHKTEEAEGLKTPYKILGEERNVHLGREERFQIEQNRPPIVISGSALKCSLGSQREISN